MATKKKTTKSSKSDTSPSVVTSKVLESPGSRRSTVITSRVLGGPAPAPEATARTPARGARRTPRKKTAKRVRTKRTTTPTTA